MRWIEQYLAYLRNNPEHYWFKRKIWGWGWTPATWEGWLVLAVFTVIFVRILVPFLDYLDAHPEAGRDVLLPFLVKMGILIFALVAICYKTGESPKWQWGIPEKEN